jgi:tripartite-type tricarboxylate transporter receptor subunit TctC
MIARRPLLAACLAAPALMPSPLVRAQAAWPNGPIRILVPWPAGGSADTVARLLQGPVSQKLGVPVVVDNRAGASGSIGTREVARNAPDGNNWVFVFDTHATNPYFIPDLGFDTKADLAPVMLVATSPMMLTAINSRPWHTVQEMLAAAKARPETVTYGTVGIGSLAHLTMELLQAATGTRLVHVPYRGGNPLNAAAAAGDLDLAISTATGMATLIGPHVRPLAQTGDTRSPAWPEIPTLIEAGVPGVAARAFWGVLAPARTPEPIITRMSEALKDGLALPTLRERMTQGMGVDIVGSSPAEFGQFLDAQMEIWGRVVRERHLRAE